MPLAPSHDLSVAVVNAQGRPVEGAFVAITIPDPLAVRSGRTSARKPSLVARTDARGVAVLRDVESHVDAHESTWRVEPLLVQADPRHHDVDPLSPPQGPLEFRVSAHGALRVAVRGRNGRSFNGAGRIGLGDQNWVLRSSLRASGGYLPEEPLREGVALFRCVGLFQALNVHGETAIFGRRLAIDAPPLLRHGEQGLAALQIER